MIMKKMMMSLLLQGLICYRPADQQRCFLQIMERSDYDHVGSLLSGPQNQVNGLSSGSVRLCQAQQRFGSVWFCRPQQ